MLQADALTLPNPTTVFQQQAPTHTNKAVGAVVGTVLVIAGIFGISALHGQWAYGDWTCALKNCVAVAPVRRRRRK
jgi:hypothetical protein